MIISDLLLISMRKTVSPVYHGYEPKVTNYIENYIESDNEYTFEVIIKSNCIDCKLRYLCLFDKMDCSGTATIHVNPGELNISTPQHYTRTEAYDMIAEAVPTIYKRRYRTYNWTRR